MMTVSDLRCEYAVNPIGLDTASPRFSWLITSDRRGTAQNLYRVRVASSLEILAQGGADIWDSGTVDSTEPFGVEYNGRPLNSRQWCCWTVEVRDNHGEHATAEPAWFEMGLLRPEDWVSTWIGFPGAWSGRGIQFRRWFELKKPVSRARIYWSGLGYCELRINGRKVGNAVLDPPPTDYSKRVLYSTHDVTDMVRSGHNIIAAFLGNGWYGSPKLIAQLEIVHPDGARTDILTGEKAFCQWLVAAGPVVSNGIYDGEVYDARREWTHWDTPEELMNPSSDRTDAMTIEMAADAPGGKLAANCAEPIRIVGTRRPERLSQVKPGVWVFDMGQNMAGWARIRVKGPRGTSVSLRFAETLYPDGTVNQENLRTARCEDIYILKGGGIEEWEPRFTYHGFRYVQVEGWPGKPALDDLDGRIVRSGVEERGKFECGNELVNRIHQNVRWTEAGNLHGIPTDCPQRNERMGWLNDMTARAEEAIHNFDMVRFFSKWLDDIADAQTPDGALPDTVPFRFGHRPCDPVCVSYLLLPWLLYQHYGDRRLLVRHFAGMKKWVNFLLSQSADGILSYSHWGDWSPPAKQGEQAKMGDSARNISAPGPLVSTAFLFYHLGMLARIAGIIGESADEQAYSRKAVEIAEVFNRTFWDEAVGGYGAGSQSCQALALYLGLVPAKRVPRAVERLVSEVNRFDGHLATGNICTKHLMEVLAEHNRLDAAWRILTQETYPGWGFMIANGATTIWERWELAVGGAMNSHNHPMLASVGAWFYRVLAGLKIDADGVGCNRFTVRPPAIPELNSASAELNTIRGLVRAAWRRTEHGLQVEVTVPVGAEARILLPISNRVLIDGKPVWVDGNPAESVDGIKSVRKTGDELEVVAESGAYKIEEK